jgi:uncharacterized membrane protein
MKPPSWKSLNTSHARLATFWIGLPLVVFLVVGWVRSSRAMIHAFDSGLYLQILSNLLIDGSWESSVTGETTFLAHHFQPVIALLLPAHALWDGAFPLLAAGGLCAALTCYLLYRSFKERVSAVYLFATLGCVILHPTIANRLFYSFVPEILALPALTFLAIALDQGIPAIRGRRWIYGACVLFAGLCKESLWPVLAFACLAQAFFHPRDRRLALTLSGLCAAIFIGLFKYWMPAHTNMTSYYGLRYYVDVIAGQHPDFRTLVVTLITNCFSPRSLHTLWEHVGLPLLFLPVFGPTPALLGALPGLFLVLASIHPPTHNLANHYFIPVLPFLWIGTLRALENRQFFHRPMARRWIPILMPAALLSLETGPQLAEGVEKIVRFPSAAFISQDIRTIRALTAPSREARVIADGNLQPLLHDYKNVIVLLGFVGNPRPMETSDLREATDIITSVDVETIDDCQSIRPSREDKLQYNYEIFWNYCEYIKATRPEKTRYPASGLTHYRLKPAPL